MSDRDRIIMVGCIVVFIAATLSGGLLGGRLNERRADLQLTYSQDVTRNMPPDVALLVGVSGSFRGLAIVYLWQRANNLKEEGKFYDAMELARLIARLQPRFKDVWVFLSWNMAYNISVATHTETERWMWVSSGVDLLRDEGIRWNPDSIGLYRQLSWIFLHKIGMNSDDMHWYYKQRLALRWQELLGTPPAGSTQAALDWFEPVATMDERFFVVDELPGEMRQEIGRMIRQRERDLVVMNVDRDDDPVIAQLVELMYLRPSAFDREATALAKRLATDETEMSRALTELVARNAGGLWNQADQRAKSADERMLEAHPQVAPLVEALGELGFKLDRELMERLGRAQTRVDARAVGFPVGSEEGEEEADAYLESLVTSDDEQVMGARDGVLLPYLRAKTLRQMNMSASFMFELMRGEWLAGRDNPQTTLDESTAEPLPIDWRHPAAHGLYWAARGVWVGKAKRAKTDQYYFEVLNTYRQVQHAMQALVHNGRISFDPLTPYYDQQPDPRFIEGYLRGYSGSGETIGGMYAESAAPESFSAGHENFLIWSINTCWWYGYMDKAHELYREVKALYGDRPDRAARYAVPLRDFVQAQVRDNITTPDEARQMIAGMLWRAFKAAYADNQGDYANNLIGEAQFAYAYYQNRQNYQTPTAYRNRAGLPPWDRLVQDVFLGFMLSPPGAVPLPLREQVWENAEINLKRAVWDRLREPLAKLDAQFGRGITTGLRFDARYPEPEGMAAFREQQTKQGLIEDVRERGKGVIPLQD